MIKLPYKPGNRIEICNKTKTVFLTQRHLNQKPYNQLQAETINIYDIDVNNFTSHIRLKSAYHANLGYKVVFNHNNKNIIVMYPNKLPET